MSKSSLQAHQCDVTHTVRGDERKEIKSIEIDRVPSRKPTDLKKTIIAEYGYKTIQKI